MVLRADTSKVLPMYLYYYLKSAPVIAELQMLAETRSGTFPQITFTELSNLTIPVPSITEQVAIVATIKCIEDKIDCNTEINDNLQQQAAALFAQYYEQASDLVPFTSVIQILGGGTPKTGNPMFWNGDVPFFTPKDVGTPYTLTTEKTITEDGLAHCNSRLYPVNTVFHF